MSLVKSTTNKPVAKITAKAIIAIIGTPFFETVICLDSDMMMAPDVCI